MRRGLEAIAAEMDGLFGGFFEWLDGQYDPQSGGFFYARSSKTSGAFTPDIESTAQALNILERCGLMHRLSAERKEGLVRFFQRKQHPETGYFYDADPRMRLDDVMTGRAVGYSLNALAKLGAAALYPLPAERRTWPAYMRSPDAYDEWLRSVSLANAWRGCDRLCNSAPYLAQMAAEEREPYLRRALAYFDAAQDRETGLWGEGGGYVRVSGTFKLLTFYKRFRIPLPREDDVYRSILHVLRGEQAEDMCYVRNPISLLSAMKRSVPAPELEQIAEITLANLSRFKRGDGGFSRERTRSPAATNVAQIKEGERYPGMPEAVPLGLGLEEGDMNAGTQAILIRWTCRELAGLKPLPLAVPPHLFV